MTTYILSLTLNPNQAFQWFQQLELEPKTEENFDKIAPEGNSDGNAMEASRLG